MNDEIPVRSALYGCRLGSRYEYKPFLSDRPFSPMKRGGDPNGIRNLTSGFALLRDFDVRLRQ